MKLRRAVQPCPSLHAHSGVKDQGLAPQLFAFPLFHLVNFLILYLTRLN